MARFGRSTPMMQRPRPLHQLAIGDDFLNLNAWVGKWGAPASTGADFFSNGAAAPGWCAMQHNSQLDSDDFEIEWVLGGMVGTVNGNEDVSAVFLGDTSGNGIVGLVGSNGLSSIFTSNGWSPGSGGANWGAPKASGTFVGTSIDDRFAFRRVGNVYTMYKNRDPTNMATWTDASNITPKGVNNRRPGAYAYNSNTGQSRYMNKFMARSLNPRAA